MYIDQQGGLMKSILSVLLAAENMLRDNPTHCLQVGHQRSQLSWFASGRGWGYDADYRSPEKPFHEMLVVRYYTTILPPDFRGYQMSITGFRGTRRELASVPFKHGWYKGVSYAVAAPRIPPKGRLLNPEETGQFNRLLAIARKRVNRLQGVRER